MLLQTLSNCNPVTASQGKHHYPTFYSKETEAQSGRITHTYVLAFNFGLSDFQNYFPILEQPSKYISKLRTLSNISISLKVREKKNKESPEEPSFNQDHLVKTALEGCFSGKLWNIKVQTLSFYVFTDN